MFPIALIALFTGKYQHWLKADNSFVCSLLLRNRPLVEYRSKACLRQYLVGLALRITIIPAFRSVQANPDSEPILPWR